MCGHLIILHEDHITELSHHCVPFSRIRHLMPVRQRLCHYSPSPRSRSWLGELDLVELYLSEFEVEARPGLELENCHCTVPKKKGMYLLLFLSKEISGVDVRQCPGTSTSTAATGHTLRPSTQVVPKLTRADRGNDASTESSGGDGRGERLGDCSGR